MEAHTEVVLDGLNVWSFSVSHVRMAKLLFRAVAVAASRLNKPMQDTLFSVDSSVRFLILCLMYSISLCFVSSHCRSNFRILELGKDVLLLALLFQIFHDMLNSFF